MPLNIGTEEPTVQKPLIKYAVQEGWTYITPSDALSLRKGEGGVLFNRILEEKLIELNPDFINQDNVNRVIQQIESVSNNIEGNAEILRWLRNEKSILDPEEKRNRNVTVIDYQNPDNNLFHVTDEWQYSNGREVNRADVMFLINGIPVAIVETKSPKKAKGIEEGLIQIREYHHETPEMLTMPQVFDITDLIYFYYGVTWNLERINLFNWKDEEKGNYEKKVKRFFNQERFLKMLKEWILFFIKDDELKKTVLRQHQSRAVEKIVDRCFDKTKKTGLIWHTQGSGKTFTMITASRQILEKKEVFGKSTVLLMIDRNELEGQLSKWVDRILGELNSLDINIEPATSKKRLQELLKSDFRGLIISMIHKFDNIPKNINTRENIFVLMDEAHRSVGGDLGNYLLGALPNATLIGFTGTPIDKTVYGKGTFKIFGKEDDKGYLDKYPIIESIEDKTTVPLKYALTPSEISVSAELLEKEFLGLAEAEGVSDVDELNKILDEAVKLKTFLKSRGRITRVAQFVAKHFKENIEPLGYKAFLVGVDREACALYKEALDKELPPEYSMAIYSPAQHDSEKYPLVYHYQINAVEEKKARKLFPKPDTLPKIFIVTDKLLTGFDAPVLYCMYLDKPMRDHVLLQAIARVNRPYIQPGDINKPCGLVVDFVGIFSKLEKALAFDSDVVNGVIENIELIFKRFNEIMQTKAKEYKDLCKGPVDDKAVEKAIDVFSDKEKREEFFKLYKEIETYYEILSPDPKLRDHIEDFTQLTCLYQIIRNAYRQKTALYGDIARKTATLIQKEVGILGLTKTTKNVLIDEKILKSIKDSNSSDNSKVINLVNSIRDTVMKESDEAPYLKSIGDRAEEVLEFYDDRQISTKEALNKVEELIKESFEAQNEMKKTGYDINTFSIHWILKQEKIDDLMKYAQIINSVFLKFPNYKYNKEEFRQMKAELYKHLLPVAGKEDMINIVKKILKLNRK